MKPLEIQVLTLGEGLELPRYQTKGSAGMDVRAAHDVTIYVGLTTLVKCGFKLACPEGYEVQIRPRSGLALKHSVTVVNTPGTIDSDYRGEVGVILINHGQAPYVIKRGDRIAQLVVARVEQAPIRVVHQLSITDRGEGGFGHTGTD
jgi:dUTP pyrophosphatase